MRVGAANRARFDGGCVILAAGPAPSIGTTFAIGVAAAACVERGSGGKPWGMTGGWNRPVGRAFFLAFGCGLGVPGRSSAPPRASCRSTDLDRQGRRESESEGDEKEVRARARGDELCQPMIKGQPIDRERVCGLCDLDCVCLRACSVVGMRPTLARPWPQKNSADVLAMTRDGEVDEDRVGDADGAAALITLTMSRPFPMPLTVLRFTVTTTLTSGLAVAGAASQLAASLSGTRKPRDGAADRRILAVTVECQDSG